MGESVSSPADAWHQDLSLLLAEGGVRGKGVWSVRHAETERDVSMFPLLGHGAGGGPCEGMRFVCIFWGRVGSGYTIRFSLLHFMCESVPWDGITKHIAGIFLCN